MFSVLCRNVCLVCHCNNYWTSDIVKLGFLIDCAKGWSGVKMVKWLQGQGEICQFLGRRVQFNCFCLVSHCCSSNLTGWIRSLDCRSYPSNDGVYYYICQRSQNEVMSCLVCWHPAWLSGNVQTHHSKTSLLHLFGSLLCDLLPSPSSQVDHQAPTYEHQIFT